MEPISFTKTRAAIPPAFPQCDTIAADGTLVSKSVPGMTLRDYFAAKAMAAMITGGITRDDSIFNRAVRLLWGRRVPDCFGAWIGTPKRGSIAPAAYEYADAMLSVREAVQ